MYAITTPFIRAMMSSVKLLSAAASAQRPFQAHPVQQPKILPRISLSSALVSQLPCALHTPAVTKSIYAVATFIRDKAATVGSYVVLILVFTFKITIFVFLAIIASVLSFISK